MVKIANENALIWLLSLTSDTKSQIFCSVASYRANFNLASVSLPTVNCCFNESLSTVPWSPFSYLVTFKKVT